MKRPATVALEGRAGSAASGSLPIPSTFLLAGFRRTCVRLLEHDTVLNTGSRIFVQEREGTGPSREILGGS